MQGATFQSLGLSVTFTELDRMGRGGFCRRARDGLYTFDAVGRLRDAQMAGFIQKQAEMQKTEAESEATDSIQFPSGEALKQIAELNPAIGNRGYTTEVRLRALYTSVDLNRVGEFCLCSCDFNRRT